MGDVVGAIPAELIEWPSSVQGEAPPLKSAANRLNTAIESLNSAPKTSGLMASVPYAGNAMLGYVARNQVIDAWVARVGAAFARAAEAANPATAGGVLGIFQEIAALGKYTTSTNSAIKAQAGTNPTAAADEAAAGTEAGAQLKEGVDTQNQSLVNGALDQLGQHQNQGAFDVPFFQTVGPKGTLAAVPMVKQAPDGLNIFDTALGTATRSAGWDPGFNSALFKETKDGQPDRNSLDLLTYGKDSTDFLTKAGDNWLIEAQIPGSRAHAAYQIFGAMGRNPAAGSAWLTGSPPGGQPGTRIGMLFGTASYLTLWQESVLSDPSVQQSFNHLLVNIGSLHDTPQLNTILHAIYPGPGKSLSQYAENMWPGVASIVAQNISMFVPPHAVTKKTPNWDYNQGLFAFAETSPSGSVHKQAAESILNAIRQWTLRAPVPSGRDGWTEFENRVGQLWALQALPLKQSAIDQLKNFQDSQAGWSRLAGLIPLPPIPGAGFFSSYAVGQGYSLLTGWLAPQLASGKFTSQYQVDANSDTVSNANVHALQETLTLKWLDQNPSQVPPAFRNDHKDYALLILANLPESPPHASSAVDSFAQRLANAYQGFSVPFDGKTAAGPGGS